MKVLLLLASVTFALAKMADSSDMMEMLNALVEKRLSDMNMQLDDLKRQLKDAKKENAVTRRRLGKIDTSDYKGVRVKAKKSMLALGPEEDIAILRMGPGKAHIQALDVSTSGSVAVGESLKLGETKKPCGDATKGHIQYKKGDLLFCDGKSWAPIRVQRNEFLTPAGLLASIDQKGELFARDDVTYTLKETNDLKKINDFSEGDKGKHPFTVQAEIEARNDGKIRWNSGWNGNDAIRSWDPILKGDFEFGCTVDGDGTNRFALGVISPNDVKKFNDNNSCGGCDGMQNAYTCRFEQRSCMYNSRSAVKSNGWNEIWQDGTRFKMFRKSGKITAEMWRGSSRVKTYTWSVPYTGDMHLLVANDGGTSTSLKDCYYLARAKSPKRNFHQLKAVTGEGVPLTGYKVTSGSLPSGMQLDAKSGAIFGKPKPVKKSTVSTFTVGVQGVSRQFKIDVRHRVDKVSKSNNFHEGEVFTSAGEIEGRKDGRVVYKSGWNGNDAIRTKSPIFKAKTDFEFGCSIDGGGANRFGMGVFSTADVKAFSHANSCGGCDGMKNSYFCRFEQRACGYNNRNQHKVTGINNMHVNGARFKMWRKGDTIQMTMNEGKGKSYQWPQKFDGEMYLMVMNDGGSSSSLKDCYYQTVQGSSYQ